MECSFSRTAISFHVLGFSRVKCSRLIFGYTRLYIKYEFFFVNVSPLWPLNFVHRVLMYCAMSYGFVCQWCGNGRYKYRIINYYRYKFVKRGFDSGWTVVGRLSVTFADSNCSGCTSCTRITLNWYWKLHHWLRETMWHKLENWIKLWKLSQPILYYTGCST